MVDRRLCLPLEKPANPAETSVPGKCVLMNPGSPILCGVAALLLAVAPCLAGSKFAVPDPPHITSIFSPKRTVQMRFGDTLHLLRYPEVLPTSRFNLLSEVNDLVEVAFPDGSVLRQGPNTLAEYNPTTHEVFVIEGTVLIHFKSETTLKILQPEIQGKDCVCMATVSRQGIKVFSLSGKLDFKGTRAKFEGVQVKEGQMYFYNGQPKLQGPFMIDLEELKRSSPITTEFPNNPWVDSALERSIKKQKWLKDMGLVEPAQTMLEGASPQLQRMNPAPSLSSEAEQKKRK